MTYTALIGHGVGLVVRGEPDSIAVQLEHARESGYPLALLTDGGLLAIDTAEDWELQAFEHDGDGDG